MISKDIKTLKINLQKLLSPDKFIPHYAERKEQDPSTLGPIAVELHWTSTCNYNCVHCSYGSRRRNRGMLSPSIIQGIVSDLIKLRTQAVYLSGGGEPTTVNGWDGYAEQLLDNGVDVALITNGVAVQEHHCAVLRRMNYIAVSVYSVDEQEYRQITGGNFYEKQFALPSMVKKKQYRAIVGARCVLNSVNFRRIQEIYNRAMDAGFDYIIFIPAVDYEQKGVGLKPDETTAIHDMFRKDYDLFDFTRTNIDSLLKRGIHHYETADYRTSFVTPPDRCTAVTIRGNAFINYDGSVYLCQPLIGDEEFSIGTLNTSRLIDLWNAPRHRTVIEKLNRRFAQGKCQVCRSIGFNKAADASRKTSAEFADMDRDPFI